MLSHKLFSLYHFVNFFVEKNTIRSNYISNQVCRNHSYMNSSETIVLRMKANRCLDFLIYISIINSFLCLSSQCFNLSAMQILLEFGNRLTRKMSQGE